MQSKPQQPHTHVIVSDTGLIVTRCEDYSEATEKAGNLRDIWKMGMAVYTLNANFPYEKAEAANA